MYGAIHGGHHDLVELFIEKGANGRYWAIVEAACGGHLEIVKTMIKVGTNYNYRDKAMYNAACKNYIDIVKVLVENGATNFQVCYNCTYSDEIKDLLRPYL